VTAQEYVSVICPVAATISGYNAYYGMACITAVSGYFGDSTELARALLVAHYYTLNTVNAGQAGVLTFKMEGRRSQAFGGVGVIRDSLELTNYGMQYKALRQSISIGISVTDDEIVSTYI